MKKYLGMTILLLGLVFTASLGTTWAYFTTYAQAQGGYTISLGDKTELRETFSAWTKHLTVTADADAQPVYIRARAFSGSQYGLTYSDESGLWTPGADGYYYYNAILEAGQETQTLDIHIDNVPSDLTDPTEFHVVVIYESTPVRYNEDGEPYGDWSMMLDRETWEGGDQE
jgi:hypothetical protein